MRKLKFGDFINIKKKLDCFLRSNQLFSLFRGVFYMINQVKLLTQKLQLLLVKILKALARCLFHVTFSSYISSTCDRRGSSSPLSKVFTLYFSIMNGGLVRSIKGHEDYLLLMQKKHRFLLRKMFLEKTTPAKARLVQLYQGGWKNHPLSKGFTLY
ncbi:hypothetical protein CW304_03155 [Bacillus sp. UFRGS-B20]|nr:hypothetical protein CW304_03155 [Bacillus sp. UFRGS-B20]